MCIFFFFFFFFLFPSPPSWFLPSMQIEDTTFFFIYFIYFLFFIYILSFYDKSVTNIVLSRPLSRNNPKSGPCSKHNYISDCSLSFSFFFSLFLSFSLSLSLYKLVPGTQHSRQKIRSIFHRVTWGPGVGIKSVNSAGGPLREHQATSNINKLSQVLL